VVDLGEIRAGPLRVLVGLVVPGIACGLGMPALFVYCLTSCILMLKITVSHFSSYRDDTQIKAVSYSCYSLSHCREMPGTLKIDFLLANLQTVDSSSDRHNICAVAHSDDQIAFILRSTSCFPHFVS
jgi:hypothetical protein